MPCQGVPLMIRDKETLRRNKSSSFKKTSINPYGQLRLFFLCRDLGPLGARQIYG